MTSLKDYLAKIQKIGDIESNSSIDLLSLAASWSMTPLEVIKLQGKKLDILKRLIDMSVPEILNRMHEIEEVLCAKCRVDKQSSCIQDLELNTELIILKGAINDSR